MLSLNAVLDRRNFFSTARGYGSSYRPFRRDVVADLQNQGQRSHPIDVPGLAIWVRKFALLAYQTAAPLEVF